MGRGNGWYRDSDYRGWEGEMVGIGKRDWRGWTGESVGIGDVV